MLAMTTFKDTDELRAYLARITTYEQFWEMKEPDIFDAREKAFWDRGIAELGHDPNDYLLPLKQSEVRRFVREREQRELAALN